jgi:hypothetical protein
MSNYYKRTNNDGLESRPQSGHGPGFPLPTTADLSGKFPDFTGDLSTEEYIRHLRSDSDDDGYPD